MKSSFRFYSILFFGIASQVYGQNDAVISSLDTISGNSEKMDYLESNINQKWRSAPDNIAKYATIYDSLSKIDGSELSKAKSLNIHGMANYIAEDYDEAIRYYLSSASILETLNVTDELSQVYSNIASTYNIRNDFENTEKYFLKGLKIANKSPNGVWSANINNNLSVIYMQNELYEKADVCIANALAYFTKKNDSIMMGIAYMNSGNSKVFTENYPEAIETYKQSLVLIKEVQFPLVHSISKTGIGISYTKQKDFNQALPYLLSGLDIAKEIKHNGQLIESYDALADYYSETENYKEAYALSLESQKLKDSVLTAEQDANMAEALTKFETEKKEAELQLLGVENDKNKQQQKLYAILAFTGLLLTSLIGFFYFKNRKKNALLAKQKSLLEATVDEKNVLLKETHHRVKNSFQIVSSLLYLQSETIEDKEAKLAMQEAQNRVRSMVLIHQKLYSKNELVGINTKEYFEDLTRDIFESHQFESNAIRYSLNVSSLILDIETITPLGLILNELITNVIKHAFDPVTDKSEMLIIFNRVREQLVLKVVDNGKGMSSEIKESSFGIQLINALAKKLKATLSFTSTQPNGTQAMLEIKRFTEL